jgi:hypothetical protein
MVGELNAAGLKTSRGTPYTKSAFQIILQNRKYLGIYIYREHEIIGGIPRLIDDELFNAVQERLKERKHNTSLANVKYLLTTKLFCGYCNNMMIGVSGTSKTGAIHNYYVCKKARQKKCDKKNVKQKYIEDIVVNECRKVLTDDNIEMIADKVSTLCEKEVNNPYIKQLKKELTRIENAIENLMQAVEKGQEVDLLLERIKSKREEKKHIEEQLARENLTKTILTETEIKFFLTDLRNGNINNEKYRKMLVNVLVNKVFLYDDRLTIFFNAGCNSVEITVELLKETKRLKGSYIVNSAPPFILNTGLWPVFNING